MPRFWRKLDPDEVETAREQEKMWVVSLPKSLAPSDQVVWLCLHCLDSPSEDAWQVLDDVEAHVQDQYVIVLKTKHYPNPHTTPKT